MLYNRPVIRPGNRTPSYTLLFPTGAGQEFAMCVCQGSLCFEAKAMWPHLLTSITGVCSLLAACFITAGEAIAVSMAVVPAVKKEQPALLCSP